MIKSIFHYSGRYSVALHGCFQSAPKSYTTFGGFNAPNIARDVSWVNYHSPITFGMNAKGDTGVRAPSHVDPINQYTRLPNQFA